MKATFKRDELGGILGVISSVAPQRSTRPILYNARVSIDAGGKTTLFATDLDVAIAWPVQAVAADGSGEFLVPAVRAFSIVREILGEEVTFVAEGEHVTVQGGKARFRLNTAPVEDFPAQPEAPKKRISLDAAAFTGMIERTVFAVAKEDFRYAINGLCILVDGERMEMTGSDGHRLANASVPLGKRAKTRLEMLVPPKLMTEVLRATSVLAKQQKGAAAEEPAAPDAAAEQSAAPAGPAGKPVEVPSGLQAELAADEGQIFVYLGDVMLVGRQLEGTYPRYHDVIPREREQKIGVNRDDLLAALRRMTVVTTEETRSVIFDVDDQRLLLSAADPSVGTAEEELAVEYSGPKRASAFDPRLLSEGLRHLKADAVGFEMEDDVEAAVVREGGYIYVIMPMRVRR